jgi:uncharacterized repeat protein (TIGR03803 family)
LCRSAVLGLAVALASAVFAALSAQAQTFMRLHSFKGTDGANPYAGLIQDAAGNLYGTTYLGGLGGGTVFKLDKSGKETLLYSFNGTSDGANPYAGLVQDATGNLFGTTLYTGGFGLGYGTIFKLDTSGKETVFHKFVFGDGSRPYAGLVLDTAGNLYGTAQLGGASDSGTVFQVNPKGKASVLYSFTGDADGRNPYAGLVRDSAGNLYGTTPYGGDTQCFGGTGCGTVFKVTGIGKQAVLHAFTGAPADGAIPFAGLIEDAAGNLYGTTYNGGTFNFGTVFKLDTSGKETVLYNFVGSPDGAYPNAGLVRDAAGNLYGTTQFGGAIGFGSVFKVDTSRKETVLYGFPQPKNGMMPMAGLVADKAGNLYGTTLSGGTHGLGVVFKLAPH